MESEVKKLKSDMVMIENDYYLKIDRLMRKKAPKTEEEAQSQPLGKDLNTSIPFKFI